MKKRLMLPLANSAQSRAHMCLVSSWCVGVEGVSCADKPQGSAGVYWPVISRFSVLYFWPADS